MQPFSGGHGYPRAAQRLKLGDSHHPLGGMIGHCLGKSERISMRAFQAADAVRSSGELQKEDVHALLR